MSTLHQWPVFPRWITGRTRMVLHCLILMWLILPASALGLTQPGIALLLEAEIPEASKKALTLPEATLDVQTSQAVKRQRAVQINPEVFVPDRLGVGDQVYLGLFDDIQLWAEIESVAVDINGIRSLRGPIKDTADGIMLLSFDTQAMLAHLLIPERSQEYVLRRGQDESWHRLEERILHTADRLPSAPARRVPVSQRRPAALPLLESTPRFSLATAPVVIDLMVLYTPAAQRWANRSATSISHVISQAMQRSQLVLDNSEIGIRLNLVHSAQINYTESGNAETDLDCLTFDPDHAPYEIQCSASMNEAHRWRDQYGADLVTLFAQAEDVGGIAWQLEDARGEPDYAFSLIRIQQAHNSYTLIHELGHNKGADHHKQQNYQAGPGLFSYSAGWRWRGQDGQYYSSVMAYEDGEFYADRRTHTLVPYFSNPQVYYAGVPTGHASEGDNARTLNSTRHVIAAYRSALPEPPAAQPSSRYLESGAHYLTIHNPVRLLPTPNARYEDIQVVLSSATARVEPQAAIAHRAQFSLYPGLAYRYVFNARTGRVEVFADTHTLPVLTLPVNAQGLTPPVSIGAAQPAPIALSISNGTVSIVNSSLPR
ncbi:reprolysin-like metallopeptidase [Thiorhodospira sibirica]|uniref:reprolysin-like metallopeptidase n=1 Tax=Thiorhodospira sibirica TaxID=154347 RepID=UPI00022C0BCC|nr:zinc-dependent metalloprotease family protein [Thiorhodospira sibirica]